MIIFNLDLNHDDFHTSELKKIIRKQENKIKHLKASNENLKKENEHVLNVNSNLFEKLNKLEKESGEKNSRFVFVFLS